MNEFELINKRMEHSPKACQPHHGFIDIRYLRGLIPADVLQNEQSEHDYIYGSYVPQDEYDRTTSRACLNRTVRTFTSNNSCAQKTWLGM